MQENKHKDDNHEEVEQVKTKEDSHEEGTTEVVELQAKVDELNDKLLRIAAEAQNTRMRLEKQIQETREYAVTNFAKELLQVMDNMQRALEHKPSDVENGSSLDNLLKGVEMTRQGLTNIFTNFGIEQINPDIGEKFNYNYHQAVSQVPSKDYEPGSIMNVMQSGYKIKDRLLRPAMVIVSKLPEDE